MKLITTAIAAVLAFSSLASATTLFINAETASAQNAAPAGSTGLGPNGAVGGIGGPVSFVMPTTGMFQLSVQDCCVAGDVYQAFIDGNSVGFTSATQLAGLTLSNGSFDLLLTAGLHTYDINDQILSYLGTAGPYGGGTVISSFSPAGLTVTGTLLSSAAAPEPGTIGLIGLALAGGLAVIRRKRA